MEQFANMGNALPLQEPKHESKTQWPYRLGAGEKPPFPSMKSHLESVSSFRNPSVTVHKDGVFVFIDLE